jgi:hypothetical protein
MADRENIRIGEDLKKRNRLEVTAVDGVLYY